MTISELMDRFGGTSAFAAALKVPTSTAHSWRDQDFVPQWRRAKILELAVERGIPLAVSDFADLPRRKREAA